MRAVSLAARAGLYAPQSSIVLLTLLTFEHEDEGTTRLVDNLTDITSRGDVYTAFPFLLTFPADNEGELPQMELVCDNVTRDLIGMIRRIATPATVTAEAILASTPDTIEASFAYDLVGATYDAKEIRLTLMREPLMSEPFPADSFTPTKFAGLFNAVDE